MQRGFSLLAFRCVSWSVTAPEGNTVIIAPNGQAQKESLFVSPTVSIFLELHSEIKTSKTTPQLE